MMLYRVEMEWKREIIARTVTEIEAGDPEQAMRLAKEYAQTGQLYPPDMSWEDEFTEESSDLYPVDVLDGEDRSLLP